MIELAVIVNPNARAMRADPGLAARLADIARGIGEVHVPTREALPSLVFDLVGRGIQTIALCGGDGTGQAVLSAIGARSGFALRPRLALLRGGTINTVAGNLGVRGTPERLLAALCARLRAHTALPSQRQGVLAVGENHGFLFATAMGARFLELYYETEAPSVLRAVGLAVAVAASAAVSGKLAGRLFRPAAVTVRVDGAAPIRFADARLVLASTLEDMGVGMRICPRARSMPDRFQLVVSGLSPSELARQLPAVRAGTALHGSPHLDAIVKEAVLDLGGLEPYTIDGELFLATRVEVRSAGHVELVRG